MATKIQPVQIKRIHMLLNSLGLSDAETKASIVAQFSKSGATSSRDLLESEADALIRHLDLHNPDASLNKMRRKLLSLGHQLGWYQGGPSSFTPAQVNHYRVNEWCKSEKCAARKPMEEMTESELRAAVTQLKLILKKDTLRG